MSSEDKVIVIYECPKCYVALPYRSCFHSCPDQDAQEDEEGFQENLSGWYEEVKKKKEEGWQVQVAGDEESEVDQLVVLILPNQPGQRYPEAIQGHDIDGSWHIMRKGESVPQGVEPIPMVEVGPGQYRRLSAIEAEEELAAMGELSLQDHQQQQEEEYRPFEELFEKYREPYP